MAREGPHIREGRVILFRGGFGGVFSTGLDQIADDLEKQGISAEVWPHEKWEDMKYDAPLVSQGTPLVLVGHSFGADAAVRLSSDLGRGGEWVDLLITIDPICPGDVPPTVRESWNIYQAAQFPNLPWFKGNRLEALVADHPKVENINLQIDRTPLAEPGLDHWNFTTRPQVQRAIVERILQVCR